MATDERAQAPADFWDDLYRERPQRWSGKVNPVLAHEAADLELGRALDLGCGEGGDAIWMAQRGWQVTAVDVSAVALERAAANAADAGVADRIVWERHDLAESFPAGDFDLVSAQFLQSPIEFPRALVLQAAAAVVAPGGTLLVVGHAALPPWSKHHHTDVHLPSPADDLASIQVDPAQWDVVRCETAERDAVGPDGEAGTLIDGIVRIRRHLA